MSILDDLDNAPQGDQTTQWLGGILAPLPFAMYGMMCIINRVGAVPGRRHDRTLLLGTDAIILGIACLSCAAVLHFHYYWGLSDKECLRDNYTVGKTSSLVILIASLAWVAWCLLRGFTQLY